MYVQVLFFASARELVGKSEIQIKLDATASSTTLMRALVLLYPKLEGILQETYMSVGIHVYKGTSITNENRLLTLYENIGQPGIHQ
jgi:hypothetical protein